MRTGRTFTQIGVIVLGRLKRYALTAVLALGAAAGTYRCSHSIAQTYPILNCERIELTYAGKAITGVEDMAYDTVQNAVYISAYDRRSNSEGGLYRFSAPDLKTIEKLKTPTPVTQPHGLTLTRNDESLSLTVIDRDVSDPKTLSAKIRRFELQDNEPQMFEIPLPQHQTRLCNANNLVSLENKPDNHIRYLITADHKSCSYNGRKRENIFAPRSSHLVQLDTEKSNPIQTVIPKLNFANGIAVAPDLSLKKDNIYVAETRKKRLSVFSDTQDGLKLRYHIKLSGGPDNITMADADYLWVAIHPNLIKFASYRSGWAKHAPSRIAHLQINHGGHEYLEHNVYDVPSDIISGATVALKAGKHIWLGAAYDTAIARCNLPRDAS